MKHLLLVLALLPFAACAAPNLEVTPHFGSSKLSGDFAVAAGSVSATTGIDDIGLDGSESTPGVRIDAKWGSPHLSVSVEQTKYSGSGATTVNLSQGSTTIPAGTDVESDLDLTYGNALITFDFLPTDMFELGIGLGVEAAKLDTEIKATTLGQSISTDESVPIPVIAARAGLNLGAFSIDGTIAAIKIDYSGDNLEFYDLDLRARWAAFEHAHFLVGYRRWDVNLDYEDGSDNVKLDVVSAGPYFGVAIAF
jgi:hypothetical protein